MTPGRRLSLDAARRVALAAQGFGRPRPAVVSGRHVQRVIDQVAQFQIDSINVAVRAQYMPLFARLGPYDRSLLDAAAGPAQRRLFEYWGHAASLIDVDLQPALRMRMRSERTWTPGRVQQILAAKPDLRERILADLAASGPLTAREIDNVEERKKVSWGWNWSEAKFILEDLFDCGTVAVASRNSQFERRYDLAERVLPGRVLEVADPSNEASYDVLIGRAARALGVADLGALTSYFYLKKAAGLASVRRLEASGLLRPVEVDGLGEHWLWHEAAVPRTITTQALVSPFDSLVFDRQRVLDLFGVHYRIEVYTPAAKRQHGYYVYLFVCDDAIAARVDLKADRGRGVLVVQASWVEGGQQPDAVAPRLAEELRAMASWLGLTEVAVTSVGTLAPKLARHL